MAKGSNESLCWRGIAKCSFLKDLEAEEHGLENTRVEEGRAALVSTPEWPGPTQRGRKESVCISGFSRQMGTPNHSAGDTRVSSYLEF